MASTTATIRAPSAAENLLLRPPRSLWSNAWYKLRHDRLTMISFAVLMVLALLSLAADVLAQHVFNYTFEKQDLLNTYQKPTLDPPAYLLGSDEIGRSQVVRLLYGGRVSLAVGFVAALMSLTVGVVMGLTAGYKGGKVTARLVKDRLDQELVGNVSLRILPTERPDAWEVQGRGELALAILVEQMRREGFELTVGKPQVVTKEVNGKVHEPFERLTIDAPEEYLGTITELLASRKGRMESMTNHGTGWVRMEFLVPARGLIGFRTEFLTDTRGTGIAHGISEGYEPWAGEIRSRTNGSLVADRKGAATAYAMTNLQERGIMFVEPTTEVYEGMIIGENSRADDMDVNITKEKQQTNIRSATSDNFEKLIPPRHLSLEQSLEFCRDDECVEVTPDAVRIRKVVLDANARAKTASQSRKANK